uniref:Uncharacterized protein n=1 Tax=Arion vulgaris TaxID=1028688 RepID=A0A0B6Z1A6_9EUPU
MSLQDYENQVVGQDNQLLNTAMSRALSCSAEQHVTHKIIISDSMNMFQRIESGSLCM